MNLPLLIFIIAFIITFILRIPIGFGMIMSSIFYFVFAGGPAAPVSMMATQFLSQMNVKFVLIAVPLFIFAAKIMNTGEITDMIFRFANSLVGRWKGGMGHVNVVASLIFSGMTGSAIADASGLGLMEIEAMRKQGYDDGFSCAITAASATIGPVFPPSIPMVFYALLSGSSVGALFLGGMVPGVLLAVALMAYVAYIAKKRNYPVGERYPIRAFMIQSFKALPALFTPIILLGGIYTGIVTPTEAGALAGAWALLIGIFVYRVIGWKQMMAVFIDTAKATGVVSIIVAASFSFSYIVSIEHIPQMFSSLLLSITENKYVLLLIVNILFLILGMFMDVMTVTLVFIPMVLPLINLLGIDLVHFGVIVVLNMMIGLSTPPLGGLLFIVSGLSKTPLYEVIKESLPMTAVMIAVLFLITYVPEFVLFLPRMIGS
ncbi:MAG: TRAP transporter large permease [Spirochaetes bacterium]|nr:MAG: TRAP transporter large permease [Spirochaetota bacterium]RKX91335.1 MAG: TRAP transporter large permease [Spirochaetota bacterium]